MCNVIGSVARSLTLPAVGRSAASVQRSCRDPVSMFGVVVVGIGIAGRVRIRDMLTPLPGTPAEKLTVKGFISRRSLDTQEGVSQISAEETVNREDIHVVFICTENASHEDSIRTFLQAGKHVCVEYPMTMNYKAAVELWDLAEEKGGPLKRGFGFPSFTGIARLTWLVELFGELSATAATMEEDTSNNYSKMTAKLLTSDNKPLTWIEERRPGLPRAKNINFHFDSCTMTQMPPAARGTVGIFMQDMINFSAKLAGQVSPEEVQREKIRILFCLKLAEKIQELCQT
ncbi:Biliverdin reductase A [Collichthys lucidus]|uniref:Biliverdin reductase A n=1 Tax=Collichthys lucidus TaxID=240159 RepID=A0A4U5U185_COLLU|nr:Biliverdin reductase A [Collichthys lucidus]